MKYNSEYIDPTIEVKKGLKAASGIPSILIGFPILICLAILSEAISGKPVIKLPPPVKTTFVRGILFNLYELDTQNLL